MGATLRIGGVEYDVEKDLSWEELMLAEELGGVPLGREDAFESMSVLGACVFVIMKRKTPALSWEEFVKQPMDITDARDDDDAPAPVNRAAKRAAKKRPPRRAA